MRLISRSQQQIIDQCWHDDTGLPLLLLMEGAALAVRNTVNNLFARESADKIKILILAGRGQNGGDAFACARLLAADGHEVICREIFPGAELPPEAKANRSALLRLGFDLGYPQKNDFFTPVPQVIIDGVFGTGLHYGRPLPDGFVRVSKNTAEAGIKGAVVVAIDIPSGVDCDTGQICSGAIKADHTVTFVRPKIGLCAAPARFLTGKIHTASIGVSNEMVGSALEKTNEPECFLAVKEIFNKWKISRSGDSHKGMFGRTLIIGGSEGMPGAVVLAARAAARSGTGLLYLSVPEEISSLLLKSLPEALINEISSNADLAAQQIDRLIADTVTVIGPGIGRPIWLGTIIDKAIRTAQGLLLDADALNHIADDPQQIWLQLRKRVHKYGLAPAVLTPHPGEFRRLAPDISLADRQSAALSLARRSGCVVVLKGASTVIAHPDNKIWLNPTGNDGLAKGGSGDVLSGLTGSLMSQGLAPEAAAVCAVYLHGLAADLAAAKSARRSILPGDVIDSLGQAFVLAGWEEPQMSGREWSEQAADFCC